MDEGEKIIYDTIVSIMERIELYENLHRMENFCIAVILNE